MKSVSDMKKAAALFLSCILLLLSFACEKKENPSIEWFGELMMMGEESAYEKASASEMLMTLGVDPLDCKDAIRYKKTGYVSEFLMLELKDHSRVNEIAAVMEQNLDRLKNAEYASVKKSERTGFIGVVIGSSLYHSSFERAEVYFFSYFAD